MNDNHVLQPLGEFLVELVQGHVVPSLNHLLSTHALPWQLFRKEKQSKVAQALKIILTAFRHVSQLVVRTKITTLIRILLNFNVVSLEVRVSSGQLEVDYD